MQLQQTAVDQSRDWETVVQAPVITPALAEAGLTAMELSRSRFVDAHLAPAQRIIIAGMELGRPDLEMRAQLIEADVQARQGAPVVTTAKVLEAIRSRAEQAGDAYALARSHFLLTWVSHALGDLPGARINGIRSVEILPEDTHPGILIDHQIMLAVACGSGPEADRCYARALDLAVITGDALNAIRVHNSIAFNACRTGDVELALDHVTRMFRLSEAREIPLGAAPLETIARAYLLSGDYDKAISVLLPPVNDPAGIMSSGGGGVLFSGHYALPECIATLAEAYRMKGDYAEAQKQLNSAKALAQDQDLRPSYTRILQKQARLYAAQGDFENAYRQHVEFYDATNDLHSDEENARARLVQASFDASEKKRDAEQFRELAMRDALTGLYNRRFIDDQLARMTTIATTNGSALSAAIVDADFFKRINDECSHEVGDEVLRHLANILASSVADPEVVGRLGGEEFVLLMPGVEAAAATARCESIRHTIEHYDWFALTDSVPVTVSVGVGTASDGQTSPAALLSDADRNLYQAKNSGRNKVVGDD